MSKHTHNHFPRNYSVFLITNTGSCLSSSIMGGPSFIHTSPTARYITVSISLPLPSQLGTRWISSSTSAGMSFSVSITIGLFMLICRKMEPEPGVEPGTESNRVTVANQDHFPPSMVEGTGIEPAALLWHKKSGRQDSNLRLLRPKRSTLARLSYFP